jgi:hypothetical protein
MRLTAQSLAWVALIFSVMTGINHAALADNLENTQNNKFATVAVPDVNDRLNSLQAQFPSSLPLQNGEENAEEDVQDCFDEDERDDRQDCLEDLRGDRLGDREEVEEDVQDCIDEDEREDRQDCLEDLRSDHRDHWNNSRPDISPMHLFESIPEQRYPMR